MEPRDVFISHVEEDWPTARALAVALRAQQLTVWTYEEDGIPGISHLEQSSRAIESCRAFVLLASGKSVKAHQVIREVEEAHEAEKVIIAVRLGLSHQEFVTSNRILRMACGTAVTLAADEANLPNIAKRIAATLTVTRRSSSNTQPSEALPGDAETIKVAASIESRVVAQAGVSGANADASRNATVRTAHVHDESSSPLRNRTSVWLWLSVLLGIVIQVALGASLTFVSNEGLSHSMGPRLALVPAFVAAIGLVVGGLLLAWSFARLWRSSGAKAVPQVTSAQLLIMWTFISGLVLAAAIAYDVTHYGPQTSFVASFLSVFVPTFVSVALVWNGLRVLRKTSSAEVV